MEKTLKERRRSSLFGNADDVCEVISDFSYPDEYVERVKKEIWEWENEKVKMFKKESAKISKKAKDIKLMKLDESILSKEQLEFLGSLNFDKFMDDSKDFVDKTIIVMEQHNKSLKYLEQSTQMADEYIKNETFGKNC